MRGAYRDDSGALAARIDAARARLEHALGALVPAWLPFLSVDAAATERAAETLEQVAQAPPTRDLAARLDGEATAVEELVAAQAELLRVVGEAPLLDRWLERRPTPAYSYPALQARGWAAFVRATRAQAVEVRYARHGPFCYEARFRIDGVPYAYGCNAFVDDTGESQSFLAAPLAGELSPFSLAPQSFLDEFVKWARGHAVEAEIGDPELDDRFLMYGAADVLGRCLGGAARAPLLDLCNTDVPRVEVADGCAVVAWRFEPEARPLSAARRFLAAVRAAAR